MNRKVVHMKFVESHPLLKQIRRNWSLVCGIIVLILMTATAIETYVGVKKIQKLNTPMPEDILDVIFQLNFDHVIVLALCVLLVFSIYTVICYLQYKKVYNLIKVQYTQTRVLRNNISKVQREYDNARESLMKKEIELVRLRHSLTV